VFKGTGLEAWLTVDAMVIQKAATIMMISRFL
jgi:hypothetical protein